MVATKRRRIGMWRILMKKFIIVAMLLAFGVTAGFVTSALAQRKQAPKTVWKVMVAGLSDVQSMVGALAVLDMKRLAQIAGELSKRERFVSNIKSLPEETRKLHGTIADLAGEISDDAMKGEEQVIARKIGQILSTCSDCHYNIRDKEAREKK
jgi:hypothetical protein